MKKLIIAGANGFLARYLTRHFAKIGWEVVGFARHREGMDPQCRFVQWDGKSLGAWSREVDGCAALINLTGRSVNCRYNAENKRQIMDSRVDSTRVIEEAIAACETPPELWLNASTATIYRERNDRANGEDGEIGEGYSVEVAKAWEKAFFSAKLPDGVRRVALRTSMVLADEPGTVYRYLYQLARFGLGGKIGDGQQMVSWIHIEDVCRIVEWLIEHKEIDGPINMTAPDPLTNEEVMRRFRKFVGMPIGLPATRWMAEIGAFILRTETELILKSRWVVPTRLLEHGYAFKYPELDLENWASENVES